MESNVQTDQEVNGENIVRETVTNETFNTDILNLTKQLKNDPSNVKLLTNCVIQLVDMVKTLHSDVENLRSKVSSCRCGKSKVDQPSNSYCEALKTVSKKPSTNGRLEDGVHLNIQEMPESLLNSDINTPILDGLMEWKIRNRSPTATEEKFYSMAFYTRKPGYRVQLRAQFDRLHGDIYFGVFVLPGVFDEYLSWPFNERFCLKIQAKGHITEDFYVPFKGSHWQKSVMNNIQGKKVRKYLNETEFIGPFNISQFINRKDILFIVRLSSEK